jgi:hypothetical protein
MEIMIPHIEYLPFLACLQRQLAPPHSALPIDEPLRLAALAHLSKLFAEVAPSATAGLRVGDALCHFSAIQQRKQRAVVHRGKNLLFSTFIHLGVLYFER